VLKNSHACVEGAMHHDCPICFEVGVLLFFNVQDIRLCFHELFNLCSCSNAILFLILFHECQYLFESTNDVSVLPCGHTIHVKCLKEMEEHCQ